MPSYPDFQQDEFERRYSRARALMQEKGVDALLITEELNYIYFTGHRSQQNPIDKIRPYVFILPREDEPTVMVMPFEVDQVLDTSWVSDVRTGGLMGNNELIGSILKEKGLGRGHIGAELGREQYMGISYNDFEALRTALPEAQFIDAAPILLELRSVKSPEEVAYIRKAAEITSTSISEAFEQIRGGMSGIEVSRILRALLAHHGGEKVTFMCVSSGLGPKGGFVQVATEKRLQPSDILVLDTGVEYRGYCGDIARSASVGEPTSEVASFYRWMMEVRQTAVNLLRPGKRPRDLVNAVRESVAKRGLTTPGIGRVGHGVGLETTEYPSLAIDEEIVFRPGMVFACNPNFVRPFGFLNAEDNWLITEGGAELLSPPVAPLDLPTLRVP